MATMTTIGHRHRIAAGAALGLVLALAAGLAGADPSGAKETCASKYPNAPTAAPSGYDYADETDAYLAFKKAAAKAGYAAVKKHRREDVTSGPCEGHGKHVNMQGTRPVTGGKSADWGHIGSMTSCEICEDTPRGPRLSQPLWRVHPNF